MSILSSHSPQSPTTFLSYIFPDLCIPGVCLLFAIDNTPHVGFLSLHSSAIFQKRCSWAWPASVAFWNRNKVVVALSAILWSVNVSLLIYGKSLSTRPADELKLSQPWILTRCHSGKQSISKYFRSSGLIHHQIRPSLVSGSCSIGNIENNKATIISMFTTDFILLVIMLVGLFRMGVRRVGTFALGRLLWKQVIWRRLLHGSHLSLM